MENIFGIKRRTWFFPWSIAYLWGSLHVSVCSVYPVRNTHRSPLKIVMELGQSVTALEPPIQYVPSRALPGHYLAPEVSGVWLFPRPAWAPSAPGLVPQGETLPSPVGLCDCANFCLFITQAGWWYVNRLCRCWGFSTAGFFFCFLMEVCGWLVF